MEITMLVLVGLIMAINQGIKQIIPARFIPLVSVVLGIAAGLLVLPYDGGVQVGIINGLAMGLSACGLFDLGKQTATIVAGDTNE
jgi:membrane protein DedA with SNARE-associated domain